MEIKHFVLILFIIGIISEMDKIIEEGLIGIAFAIAVVIIVATSAFLEDIEFYVKYRKYGKKK